MENSKTAGLSIKFQDGLAERLQITIDNHTYELDTLSDEAKAQLQSLQFCDAELVRLQAQTAVLQTARMAYSKALQASLPSVLEQAQASETMKFN